MTRLFAAVFGGAIAWSLHLVLSYLVVGLACRPEGPLLPAGGGVTTAILLALSVVAAAAALGATIMALRIWRQARGGEPGPDRGRRGIAFVGLLLDLVFLAAIVFGASAAFVVPTC